MLPPMSTRTIRFSAREGERLGTLDLPDTSTPRAFVLFAHCFDCAPESGATGRIAGALTAKGFGVLRVDVPGLWGTDHMEDPATFQEEVEDLVAAARWLESEHAAPAILVGHSLAGAAMLRAAHDVPGAKAVATIGAPDLGEHLGDVGHLRRALLVMHAPMDDTVAVDQARRIYQAARHPKSFLSLDDADHLLSRAADAEYAATMIAAWSSRYLDDAESRPSTVDEPGPPEGEVVVATGAKGYRSEVRSGRHRYLADEPVSVGGTDTGPAPYDLLLGALGACTSMTLRMYADRKGLDLQKIVVHLSHQKVHAKDCEECETPSGKVDVIKREIELHGDLTPEQRARVLEIADKCPVHRTLHSEVVVRTSERVGE